MPLQIMLSLEFMLRGSLIALLSVLLLVAGVYPYRHSAMWLLHDFLRKPEKVQFQEWKGEHIHMYYVPDPDLAKRVSEIGARMSQYLSEAEEALSFPLSSPLEVYLYTNWEQKGNHARDIRISHIDSNDTIHCIVDDRFDGTKERLEYELLMRLKYGKPFSEEWGEIAAASFSGMWNQDKLNEWAGFLLARGLGPEFPSLFTSRQISIYQRYPWNALFLRFLRNTFGWDAMIEMYRYGRTPPGYETKWSAYVSELSVPSKIRSQPFHPEFQKGISYAYRNSYDRGYATDLSRKSLDRLRSIGVNWIAAIPYGYMESNDSQEVQYAGHSIIGESDESMLAVVQDAKFRGMKVLMKPQIWISHSSWPGAVEFPDEASWRSWHQSYERWIVHYAILAELIDADAFCVGTEFVRATLEHPDEWRRIIRRVRDVYHGPLVYAANHGKEFENIEFWNDLDYIGLNNYYAIRGTPESGTAEMKEAFLEQKEKIHAVAQRFQKPVIFTEIGYTATQNSGMSLKLSESGSYDEYWQDQCYRLALETYWNESWFYGFYWWKWFSDPSDQGTRADKHSPHGRPSEEILKLWYQKPR